MKIAIKGEYLESYNQAVKLNLGQRGSKLELAVRRELQTSERKFYNHIKQAEAFDIVDGQSNTPLVNSENERRAVTLIHSDWADLVDESDNLENLKDPTSSYCLNAAYALGRRKDKRIIDAALGVAKKGHNGEEEINLPSSQIIPVDYSDNESGEEQGLTLDKIRLARQKLDDAEVDENEKQYMVVSSKQMSDLLKTVEGNSDDYLAIRSLVDGKITNFMGFEFIRVASALLPVEDGVRKVFCFSKNAILLATGKEITTNISQRADKRMALQVYASMACGASRMSESQVVAIECKED